MDIKKASFIKSAVKEDQYPEAVMPAVAVVGKSNVGKSSFINCIANNFKLAKTSGQPGKTRLINFFLFNENFYLVDLPGYGYARVSRKEMEGWGVMIERYLTSENNLRLLVLLVDIRHNPTQGDIQMLEWIRHFGFNFVIVATKADKLSKSKASQNVVKIAKKLEIQRDRVIPFSSVNRAGKEKVLAVFEEYI